MARENASYLGGRHDPKNETAIRARQGVKGRPVLVILIVSLLLSLVVWAVVEYSVFEADENRPPNLQTETAPASTSTNPAPQNP
jgi:hypothetical protein